MDFLNKAYGQLNELFGTMTPAARLTTGLLVAVIAISLIFLFRQQSDRADEFLFGGRPLTNGELTEAAAAFARKNLNDWETEGNRLRVPRSQRDKYFAALFENHALPEDWDTAYREAMRDQSMLENRQDQEFRRRFAEAKTLAFTIREFDGITNASVQIQEVPEGGFRRTLKRTAAVSIATVGNRELEPAQVKMIRDYVAAGGGIDPVEIAITDGVRSYPAPPRDGTFAAGLNAYVETQRAIEQETKAKIQDRLDMYPGAKVTVSVLLDQKLENRTMTVKFDEKPTPQRIRTESRESSTIAAPNQGRPGAEPNGVGNRSLAVTGDSATESTETFSVEEQENAPGLVKTTVTEAPLTWFMPI